MQFFTCVMNVVATTGCLSQNASAGSDFKMKHSNSSPNDLPSLLLVTEGQSYFSLSSH